MNRSGEPLPLMSGTERDSYCDWLKRLAGTKRGDHPTKLRKAARELRGYGGDE